MSLLDAPHSLKAPVSLEAEERSNDRHLDALASRLQFILDRLQYNAEQHTGEMIDPDQIFETDVETTSRAKGRLDVMLADVIDELKASALPSE